MTDLRRSIKNQIHSLYSNDSTGYSTLVTGGQYHMKPPAGVTQENYPIVLYQIVTTSSEYYMGMGSTPSVETPLVEFKILSASTVSTEAENILEKLVGVFDGASLTLSGYGLREMRREPRNSVTGPYVDDNDIININVVYRLVCDKS